MNNNNKKLLVTLGVLAVGGWAAYKAYQNLKKRDEQEEAQEQQEKEQCKKAAEAYDNVGANFEKICEEVEPEEFDIVKAFYSATRFNPRFDISVFDIDLSLENTSNLLSIMQRTDNRGRRSIDFVFNVPRSESGYKGLKVPDYLRSFSEASSRIKEVLGNPKLGEVIRTKLNGNIIYTINRGDYVQTVYMILPEGIYKEYADEKHDGLVKFVETHKVEEDTEWFYNAISEDDLQESGLTLEDIELEDLYLTFTIRIPLKEDFGIGVDLIELVEVLNYLVNEFSITKGEKEVIYNHLLFNAASDDDNKVPDLNLCYDVDKNNKVIIVDLDDDIEE